MDEGGVTIRILSGDCREQMKTLPDNSVDAIVTDPPYGLSFMGKRWDYDVPGVDVWTECLRVLKPGGHLLAFAGTRTQHRMAVRIEDAGFEIRDMIAWVYGSGFPKSLDVSKAIDKAAGAEREVVGVKSAGNGNGRGPGFRHNGTADGIPVTAATTEAAREWDGWGTALKPSLEPITMARKPLRSTVAANVLQHGTGALNIDACRVEFASQDDQAAAAAAAAAEQRSRQGQRNTEGWGMKPQNLKAEDWNTDGRWPANLIHDGSAEVLAAFPEAPGQQADISATAPSPKTSGIYGAMHREGEASQDKRYGDDGIGFQMKPGARRLDEGSAARFFYCAKASKEDRNDGLQGSQARQQDHGRKAGNPGGDNPRNRGVHERQNHHPTVKPTDLMRYLCRLVTPPGGTVLDPFMGSGSTLKAAELEGFSAIGIELDPEYVEIARRRISSDAPLFANIEAA